MKPTSTSASIPFVAPTFGAFLFYLAHDRSTDAQDFLARFERFFARPFPATAFDASSFFALAKRFATFSEFELAFEGAFGAPLSGFVEEFFFSTPEDRDFFLGRMEAGRDEASPFHAFFFFASFFGFPGSGVAA